MAFTYTQIADHAIEDFVTYQLMSTLIESQRYISEDILGVDQGDTDGLLGSLTMNNGATHGGGVVFGGDAIGEDFARYLIANAAGTQLQMGYYDLIIPSPKIIQGERIMLNFFGSVGGTDQYLSTNHATRSGGFKAPKAGSIIGITFAGYNINGDTFTAQCEAHKNASSVFATSGLSFSGASLFLSTYASQARNADAFAAGDYIDAFMNFTSGGNTIVYGIGIEIMLDT